MTTTLPVIDADAHVIETERTWDYLEPSEQKYRPQLFYSKDDGNQQYWVIDGKIRGFRFPTLNEQQLRELSQKTGRNLETPQAASPKLSVTDFFAPIHLMLMRACSGP